MKHLLRFSIVILIVFLVFGYNSQAYKLSNDEKIVNQITHDTADKLQKKTNLILIGTGGQMMHEIEMLAMSFTYYQEVNLKTARELTICAINEYLSAINSNEELRPYLNEYPFTAKNIEIRIWILNAEGSNPPPDKIYYISAINGNLAYYLDLPETYSRQAICEETYEEALTQSSLPGK